MANKEGERRVFAVRNKRSLPLAVDSAHRILVTGATGFLGYHTLRALSRAGYEVSAVARNSENLETLTRFITEDIEAAIKRRSQIDEDEEEYEVEAESALHFNIVRTQLNSVASLTQALDGGKKNKSESATDDTVSCFDTVIHMAAIMDFFPSDEERLRVVNVEGTRALLTACKLCGVKRFIYMSSTEVIGPTSRCHDYSFSLGWPVLSIYLVRDGSKADENTPLNPSYFYGQTKAEAEELVRTFCEEAGIAYIILRPTGIYGPRDGFAIFEMLGMIYWGLLCFIPGDGKRWLMFTHVYDVVQAIVHAVSPTLDRKALNQTYIIAPNEALTYEQWISTCSRLLRRPQPFFHLPVSLAVAGIRLLAPIMNIGKPRVFMYHPRMVSLSMQQNRVYSNAKAKQLLGFKPRYNIETGLSQTVRWYQSHGKFRRSCLDWCHLSPVLCSLFLLLVLIVLHFTVFQDLYPQLQTWFYRNLEMR